MPPELQLGSAQGWCWPPGERATGCPLQATLTGSTFCPTYSRKSGSGLPVGSEQIRPLYLFLYFDLMLCMFFSIGL